MQFIKVFNEVINFQFLMTNFNLGIFAVHVPINQFYFHIISRELIFKIFRMANLYFRNYNCYTPHLFILDFIQLPL